LSVADTGLGMDDGTSPFEDWSVTSDFTTETRTHGQQQVWDLPRE
jgi:hypothetical protein